MSKPVPILVGVGQNTIRSKTMEDYIHPVEAMKIVVQRAAEDAGCPDLIARADALHVVNILSFTHKDFPGALAEALGANPATREYTAVGGNNPQWLVNRAADNIASGKSEIAILAGCEVMKSFSLAMKTGKDIGAFKEKPQIPLVGVDRPGTTPIENAHFADRPVRIYPMIENALRKKEGTSLEAQRAHLGQFAESFSAVAAKHSHSWFPVKRTAEEAVTVSPQNRMISWPYTKYLNSVIEVDMAAAVIMTSVEKARALGIPESKWVYLHGGQDAHDHWFVSERPDIAESLAIRKCVGDALDQAQIGLEKIAFFDLYSCFPVMPRLTRHVLGVPHDDARPMTITGGLPYFGGAGNNYVMHSIAEAVNLLREKREQFGMITSNGFYSTKHGVGIYSGMPPTRDWQRTAPEEFQKNLGLPPAMEVDENPNGAFHVESYTVWHDREGQPEQGILMGRTDAGQRAWAQTPKGNKDILNAMMNEEWCGKTGRIVEKTGSVNRVEF